MFSKEELINELEFIELNFEFSPECPTELQNHLYKKGLIVSEDDLIMLTHTGELQIGYTKDELRDTYGDYEGENEDDEQETY